ncbi:hypothetical protein J2X63_002069 [Agromyces sp. 3263]|nr:hypothetical protein [Agromyces sp. 3263]
MPINPTFSTLWAVNGPLDLDDLCRQLDAFVVAGLDGVVFHPRFYPEEPRYLAEDYLAIVSALIIEASDRGLAFWIYDENGWPSGTVGGRMLERHPELRQRWVELQRDTGQPALARFDRDGARWAIVERVGAGVDYLAPALAERFIELCYARYADGLAPEAFARVAGFFSDEPEFGLGHAHHELSPHGAIPWTPDLPERFAERHGDDLLELLPAVFLTEERSAVARERFWELAADLFAERYLTTLDRWCRARGLRFTAHMKGEEHPLFQLPTVGSLGPVARAVGLPGIDALGRHPLNDFYPRQVSSAARQFGDGRTMAEAFGGAGWGASPADLERYLRWLGGHGVTDFVLHLSQYRLDSAAIEDWPPSHPRHVSWSAAYADVLGAVRQGIEVDPRPPADVLVVVPQRALARVFEPWEFVATNVHDAHDFPATSAGAINGDFLRLVERLRAGDVAYEFADERTLERDGAVVDGCLVLGRSRYARVIVPPAAALDPGLRTALEPLHDEGLLDDAPAAPAAVSPWPTVDADADADADADRAAADAADADAPAPLRWRLERSPVNELVLQPTRSGDEWIAEVESLDFEGELELRLADEPAAVAWGERTQPVPVPVRRAGDVWVGAVRIESGARLVLRFRPRWSLPPGTVPRAWIAGTFRVRGELRARGGVVSSFAGPFRLGAASEHLDRELVEAGFPFLFEPLELVADVDVPLGADVITLTGGVADAAGIRFDDGPVRWRWVDWGASGWAAPVQAVGAARVRLRLTPSSFNRYGPHHHYVGDPAVVSPAQMQGERNYADLDDAPLHTHLETWWVRRLVLPDAAVFSRATSGLVEASDAASGALGAPVESVALGDIDNSRTTLVK